MTRKYDIVVAGHACIDLIPEFNSGGKEITDVLSPGKLVDVGSMTTATGGAVSNTGGALNLFGFKTVFVSRVGRDILGDALISILKERGCDTAHMSVSESDPTSYSVVINVPGIDRIFLHCPGANDVFDISDIPFDVLEESRIFHFGYPPLMRGMFEDGGECMKSIFERAKKTGVTTSLDMARPDPNSPAGKVDWLSFLRKVLPFVDVFLPSLDELIYMIDRDRFDSFDAATAEGSSLGDLTEADLADLADKLIGMGVAVVGLKLGDSGFYVHTTSDKTRFANGGFGAAAPAELDDWLGVRLLEHCFKVDLVGATGAGDCTIAGFLAGILEGQTPSEAAVSAVAAGACNVEKADSLSGIPSWDSLMGRIDAGWEKL
ncbi:MAG: carbohydrate kinase family protein [Kiritimatiellaeota bacterium]|nr:carbohydrate kinase family protein [Kiritimatiellota bacterium]